VALVNGSTAEIVTYRQLDARSNQLAQLLYAQGLRPGDHVALYLENHLAYFDVLCACMRSGLYLTPLNRFLPAGEAAYITEDCDAKALIASSALEHSAELGRLSPRCAIKLAVGGGVAGFIDYESALVTQPSEKLADERLGSFMLYSSGTTGRPKGILRRLPDASPVEGSPSWQFMADLLSFDRNTVYLSPAPLYHSAPLGSAAAAIQSGATVVMMDHFDAQFALTLMERYRVTHSQWVPTMFSRLLKLDEPTRGGFDLSSHRCAVHSAAPCPVEIKRQMIRWWGPILLEYYGSTEAVGFAVITSPEWLEHPGSVGRSRGKPFHICDETGRELPAGESGLIYCEASGATHFGYHKDPGKTTSAAHPAHADWVTVGDIGYVDADGYLYLTDRKAFMIISGGVNIYPQQIEDALAMHPKVADVAVIGVPNADLGEEVKAVVQPAPGVEGSKELADEIMEYIRGKLGRQLTPRSVDFIDELPRLPTGKLYKKLLRDRYWPAVTE
jgi:long-chain acyl-CoA synthetase